MIRNSLRHTLTEMGRLAWTGLALFIMYGCAHVPTQTGAMQHTGMEISPDALHVQVVECGRRYCGEIETAADEILARSEDPQDAYDVLLWKAYAIPLIQEAALRTDPMLAAGDLWAFSIQQRDFFASGAGHDAFGPYHGVALTAAEQMERESLAFMRAHAPGDTLRARTIDRMHAWAASHPFQSLHFTRESAVTEFNELLGLKGSGLGATVSDMNRTVASMSDRMGYMNESMLKQVRWNTALMVADATKSPEISPTLAATNRALERLGTLAEITPAMVDSMGAGTIAIVREERIAAIEALSAERIAVMRGMADERMAVLAAVRDERVATLAAADEIAAKSVERAERAVTRLMWLGAVIVALLAIGAWILVMSARRMWRMAGGPAAA